VGQDHPAWFLDGKPTSQASAVIEALQKAGAKGLNPEDYDASRWPERLRRLPSASSAELGHLDVALTVCLMRYVSDLRIGRVNPQHFKFNLDIGSKRIDLAEFIRTRIVSGNDIPAQLEAVEPPFAGYRRTQEALQRYEELAREGTSQNFPVPARTVDPGATYAGVPGLDRFLRLVGDLPADAPPPPSDAYQGELVDAVKRFQLRHGLDPDGRLGPQTIKQMNVPLRSRVHQLQLTLERWRWVPFTFSQPPIVVNIPEFRLRAYGGNGKPDLSMNVIVGKSYRHQTPVFERDMTYVVFRPYWNVPISIQRSEIVPAVQKNRNYISAKGYEVITPAGQVVTSGPITDEVLEQLRTGKLYVRQKPGPSNALGLVKLMFPNEYNVYLHSTPSPELFARSRRDFSHGCIRVEKPAELAAWALRNNEGWNLERVEEAMKGGKDNLQVNLAKPVPVLILYGTAVVDPENQVHFYDDIYGYDASLDAVLAKGYPYP
jgi:murein L,D-transpeptidase YcbB/YkuD